jgi:hypothetical protein
MYYYGDEEVHTPNIDYERYGDTVYCPFDPALLEIGGEKFMVNVAAEHASFKELGRFISCLRRRSKPRLVADFSRIWKLLKPLV